MPFDPIELARLPQFRALDPEARRLVLSELEPSFLDLDPQAQADVVARFDEPINPGASDDYVAEALGLTPPARSAVSRAVDWATRDDTSVLRGPRIVPDAAGEPTLEGMQNPYANPAQQGLAGFREDVARGPAALADRVALVGEDLYRRLRAGTAGTAAGVEHLLANAAELFGADAVEEFLRQQSEHAAGVRADELAAAPLAGGSQALPVALTQAAAEAAPAVGGGIGEIVPFIRGAAALGLRGAAGAAGMAAHGALARADEGPAAAAEGAAHGAAIGAGLHMIERSGLGEGLRRMAAGGLFGGDAAASGAGLADTLAAAGIGAAILGEPKRPDVRVNPRSVRALERQEFDARMAEQAATPEGGAAAQMLRGDPAVARELLAARDRPQIAPASQARARRASGAFFDALTRNHNLQVERRLAREDAGTAPPAVIELGAGDIEGRRARDAAKKYEEYLRAAWGAQGFERPYERDPRRLAPEVGELLQDAEATGYELARELGGRPEELDAVLERFRARGEVGDRVADFAAEYPAALEAPRNLGTYRLEPPTRRDAVPGAASPRPLTRADVARARVAAMRARESGPPIEGETWGFNGPRTRGPDERPTEPGAVYPDRRIVYHGSGSTRPVERFDAGKVLSGTGANTEGWGVYVAQHPVVGRIYAAALSGRSAPDMGLRSKAARGARLAGEINARLHASDLTDAHPDMIVAEALDQIADFAEMLNRDLREAHNEKFSRAEVERLKEDIAYLNEHADEIVGRVLADQTGERASMHELELRITDAEVLRYDAPFLRQHPEVKDKLRGAFAEADLDPADLVRKGYRGAEAYAALSRAVGGDKEASQLLVRHGIVANQYPDAGSRLPGAEDSTWNYVVFDPSRLTTRSVGPIYHPRAVDLTGRMPEQQRVPAPPLFRPDAKEPRERPIRIRVPTPRAERLLPYMQRAADTYVSARIRGDAPGDALEQMRAVLEPRFEGRSSLERISLEMANELEDRGWSDVSFRTEPGDSSNGTWYEETRWILRRRGPGLPERAGTAERREADTPVDRAAVRRSQDALRQPARPDVIEAPGPPPPPAPAARARPTPQARPRRAAKAAPTPEAEPAPPPPPAPAPPPRAPRETRPTLELGKLGEAWQRRPAAQKIDEFERDTIEAELRQYEQGVARAITEKRAERIAEVDPEFADALLDQLKGDAKKTVSTALRKMHPERDFTVRPEKASKPKPRDPFGLVGVARSKDETRHNIHALARLDDGRLVATDGHRLHMIEGKAVPNAPTDANPNLEFRGERTAFAYTWNATQKRWQLYEGEPYELPNVDTVIPKDEQIVARLRLSPADVTALHDAARASMQRYPSKTDGVFAMAIPGAVVNAAYLADALAAARDFAPKADVEIGLVDRLRPVRIRAVRTDGSAFTAIVMPMRGADATMEAPAREMPRHEPFLRSWDWSRVPVEGDLDATMPEAAAALPDGAKQSPRRKARKPRRPKRPGDVVLEEDLRPQDAVAEPEFDGQSDLFASAGPGPPGGGNPYVGPTRPGHMGRGEALAPAQAETRPGHDPVRREAILARFLERLDHRANYGARNEMRQRPRLMGYQNMRTGATRVRFQSDLETTAHEIAHELDRRFPEIRAMYGTPSIVADQMLAMSYDVRQPWEGFAEFVRGYMTQGPYTARVAPDAVAWLENVFLPAHPEVQAAVAEARQGMHDWFNQSSIDQARSKIGGGGTRGGGDALDPNVRSWLWNLRNGWLREHTVDAGEPFRRAEFAVFGRETRVAERENFGIVGAGLWRSARLSRAKYATASEAVVAGPPVWQRDGSIRFDTEQPSLTRILGRVDGLDVRDVDGQPWNRRTGFMGLRRGDPIDALMLYFVGRRARELRTQGRENLFTDQQIADMVRLGEVNPEFESIFQDYQRWNRALLDFAQEAGVIDPAARARWETDFYVPFYRENRGTMRLLGHGTPPGSANPIHRLTGGSTNLRPILQNILDNTSLLIDAAITNKVRLRAFELAEQPGGGAFLERVAPESARVRAYTASVMQAIEGQMRAAGLALPQGGLRPLQDLMGPFIDAVGPAPPRGANIVAARDGGRLIYAEVHDPAFLRAFLGLNRRAQGRVMRVLSLPTRVARRTTITSADFMAANMQRDPVSQWVLSRMGFTPRDTARGILSRIRRDPLYEEFLSNGGGMAGQSLDEGYFRRHRRRLAAFYRRNGVSADTVLDTPRRAFDFVETIGDAVEASSRIGEYQAALRRGEHPLDAAYEAREAGGGDYQQRPTQLDFAGQLVNTLYDLRAFLRPAVIGFDRMYRGIREGQTAADGGVAMRGVRARWLGMMLAGLTFHAMNREDPLGLEADDIVPEWDRIDSLAEWDRNGHWHAYVPTPAWFEWKAGLGPKPAARPGEGYIHGRIVKPFEIGASVSLVERTWDELIEHIADETGLKGPDRSDWLSSASRIVLDQFRLNPTPDIAETAIELFRDEDSFTGAPIEGPVLEGLEPWARAPARGSRLFREAGRATRNLPRALQVNPARAEHVLGSFLNYWMTYGDMLVDRALFADVPDIRDDQVPGVRRFYKGATVQNTRQLNEIRESMIAADELVTTTRAMIRAAQMGDLEAREIAVERLKDPKFLPALALTRDPRKALRALSSVRQVATVTEDLEALRTVARTLAERRPDRSGTFSLKQLEASPAWRSVGGLKKVVLNELRFHEVAAAKMLSDLIEKETVR